MVYHQSGKRGSNPRPSAWEADALPLSYSRKNYEPSSVLRYIVVLLNDNIVNQKSKIIYISNYLPFMI
jgi:hypothetical protein